jgi:hypothetical protein
VLDIRMPIGLLFTLLGALLATYGATSPATMYRISLGYNLNLWWGGAMLAFGLGMFLWQRLNPQTTRAAEVVVETVEEPTAAGSSAP